MTVSVLAVSVGALFTVLWGLRAVIHRAGAFLLVGWFFVALLSSWLGFYQGAPGRIPTIEFGLLVPIIAGLLFYWRSPRARRIVSGASQGLLVGIQIYRIEGLIFLLLLAAGRMPRVFAFPAGVGDVAVGLLAPVVAWSFTRGLRGSKGVLLAWNLLGLADLAVALTTGFLSSPSPAQMLAFDQPNTLITAFPIVMIPVFLVPLAILLHLASLEKLRRDLEQPYPVLPGNGAKNVGRGEAFQ